MNIQFLTPQFFYCKNSNQINKNCGLKYSNLSPLKADTVSFGVGEKKLEPGAKSINYDLAMQVVKEAKEDAVDLSYVLNKYLKTLVATSKNPKAPICVGGRGIHVRVKEEDSLRDKVTPRSITTMWGVKNVGDVIGARIVLRDASPKQVDKVLAALANAVKQGALNVVEIEKYNPKESSIGGKNRIKEDPRDQGYGTSVGLEALEDISNVAASVGTKESGYPAIHITIKTKHGFKAEVQIMDANVEELKEIEDLGYKIRCGKPVADKYTSLQDKYANAFEYIEQNDLDEPYMAYVIDSYNAAFNAPAQKYNTRKKAEFLKIPYYLPQDLDFMNMAQDMERCSRVEAGASSQKAGKKLAVNGKK